MAKKKKSKTEQASNTYEAMFLFPPPGANDVEHMLSTARQMIERHDGKIIHIKKWDERRLAYEIGGNKRGTYILSYFRAPGATVSAVEREVNLSEEVLRVIVLKADHLTEDEMAAMEPQPIQPREERSFGGGYGGYGGYQDRGYGDRGDRGDRSYNDRPPRRREETPEGAAAEK